MSLELEREQTVQMLCQHFAHDQLTTQELERRLESVYRASSAEELRALVAGLPALRVRALGEQPAGVARRDPTPANARRLLSIFGSVKKRGEWEPAEHTDAVALFGEMVLDFREARIPAGLTTIAVSAVFSHVRIIVPPGLHVECDGSAVLGEFTDRLFLTETTEPGASTLRITGMAVFGQVEVKMRLPE